MKFRIIVAVLTITIIGLFAMVVYLATELSSKNEDLEVTLVQKDSMNVELSEAKLKYASLETSARDELEKCLNDGTRNSWEIASGTNTLSAYSNFVDNCNPDEAHCNEDELKEAVNSLLNADGYVQMVETNGNPLFTVVKLSLEGKFVKFKTDKAVRNGAIGISNCGSSNPARTGGIVLQGKIVKVLDECNASSSQSVWGHIQYTN